jgi:dipeptidyl aminopeptidase/acylaminoacyl peptidase
MRKRVLLITLGVLFALTVVPVLVTQLTQQEPAPKPVIDLNSMTYEDIRFKNPTAGIDLAGMLFVPDGEPPFPTVVIIHGSGPSKRTSPWYLTYAGYLQQNGIAVLLPDKRGCEASSGDYRNASLEDLATDTLSAISYLKTEHPQLVQSIGILGVSQGGIIAPIVASRTSDVAFAINVVGGAVTMSDQFTFEENNNLREMGLLPGFSNAISYLTVFINRNITNRDFWSVVGNFDPIPYWEEVDVPALVLLGKKDANMPSAKSQARLNALSMENILVVVYEESGHDLEAPPGIGGDYQREDALELIRDFILDRVAAR